jgi:hypothetical protein
LTPNKYHELSTTATTIQENAKKYTREEEAKLAERLHSRWKVLQDRLERERAEKKAKEIEKENEEFKKLTFKPEINKNFRNLSTEPISSRYMQYELDFEKKKNFQMMALENWAHENPFRPHLTERSRQMTSWRVQSRSPGETIHDVLYRQGMEHTKHMNEWREMAFKEAYPFKPTLPHDIDKFIKKRPALNQKDFTERLIAEKEEKEQRLIAARLEKGKEIDPKTGKRLYHPSFNHDEFYWKVKKRDDSYFGISLDVNNLTIKCDPKIWRPEKVDKTADLKALFDTLDEDKDGKISLDNMNILYLEPRTKETLSSFFEWIHSNHIELDFEAFCKVVQQLGIEDKLLQVIFPLTMNNF